MSMTRDQLLHYLEDPSKLNERTLGELREILDEYPYFQSAHLLYVRNLQQEHNFRFAGQLKTSAVYVSDRALLYHLLNSRPEKQLFPTEDEKTGSLDQEGLMSTELLNFEHTEKPYVLDDGNPKSEKPLGELAKEIGHLTIKKEREIINEQNDDLIDRFIKENPPFSVKQPGDLEVIKRIESQIDSSLESDEFITETLARIYKKQGLYQKSINAFQRLSLKYPEKSVYFARQIEDITNLINK